MAVVLSADAQAAIQYLTWALEEIEKTGNRKAAQHARLALDELRGVHLAVPAGHYAEETKRFRDKADEAEQLMQLAKTASRRVSLVKIAESYRLIAEHMERSSPLQTKAKSK